VILLRERLKVIFLFVGIALCATGGVILFPLPRSASDSHQYTGKGMFPEVVESGAATDFGPWLLGSGFLLLVGAFLLRDQ
jgi:hypothetical protein